MTNNCDRRYLDDQKWHRNGGNGGQRRGSIFDPVVDRLMFAREEMLRVMISDLRDLYVGIVQITETIQPLYLFAQFTDQNDADHTQPWEFSALL